MKASSLIFKSNPDKPAVRVRVWGQNGRQNTTLVSETVMDLSEGTVADGSLLEAIYSLLK